MGTKKQTKYDAIKQYLLDGNTISSMEAFNIFHETRLSAIIHTMKHRDNIDIESCTEQSPEGAYYSRYWVNKEYLAKDKEVDYAAAKEQAAAD